MRAETGSDRPSRRATRCKGDLRRLTHGADEQQHGDCEEDTAVGSHGRSLRQYFGEGHGTELLDEQEDAEQETEVADAVHDESLVSGFVILDVFEPEPDKQVGTEAHAFPSDEHHHIVGAEHEDEHGENEEVEVREITRETFIRFIMHIRSGVNVDQGSHTGNDQEEQSAQLVYLESEGDMQAAYADEVEKRYYWGMKPGVRTSKKISRLITNAATTLPLPTMPVSGLDKYLLPNPLIRKPNNGKNGTSQTRCIIDLYYF